MRNKLRLSKIDILHRIEKIAAAKTEDFDQLVKLSGLNPNTDFVDADLSGIDLSDLDISRFNLKGCLVSKNALKSGYAEKSGAVECDVPIESGQKSREIDWLSIEEKRSEIVHHLNKKYGQEFQSRTKAVYSTKDEKLRAVITLSKRYRSRGQYYWYALHPSWISFLKEGKTGLFVLGGTDLEYAYAVPIKVLEARLAELSQSTRPNGGIYWHIHVEPSEHGMAAIRLVGGKDKIALTPYVLPLE